MSQLRIGLIVGSVRPNRFADKPAQWIKAIAERRGDMTIEVLDLKDYPLPFFDETASPAWGPSKNEVAQRWQKIASLDGFIITAAEYNRGPTAVLGKNAMDYAYSEWAAKPVTFVGYGGTGAVRAVEQLRLHAIELQMAPVRHAVHILGTDMRGDAGSALDSFEALNKSAETTLDQLAWWGRALKRAREADTEAKAA